MGFRQGAANVFANDLAPKPVTQQDANNLGQLIRGVQQDKIENATKQKDLTITAYEKLASLFGNANKLNPQQKKMLAKPITGLANNVLGYSWDESLIVSALGDEKQAATFSKGFQDLIDNQGGPGESEATARLAGAGTNVEQLTEAIQFAQQQKTANKVEEDSPLDIAKFANALTTNVRSAAKVPIKVVTEANKLISLSTDQQSGFTATAAISVFARLVDPDSSVRVQEAANIAGISPGVIEAAKTDLGRLISGKRLRPRAWAQMKQAAAVMAMIENEELEKTKNVFRERTKNIKGFDIDKQVLNQLPVPSASLLEFMNAEKQRQSEQGKTNRNSGPQVESRQTKLSPVKPDQMARGRKLLQQGKDPEMVIKFLERNGPIPEAQKKILRQGAK